MSESNTGVPQAMLTQQRAPASWSITQCPHLDAAYIARLGKDGWEPFSVHAGPDGVLRIWWRKREWGS
jgi:hypothetical protein